MEAMHKLLAMKDINGVYYDEINTDIIYGESVQAQIAGQANKKGWNIIKAYISKAVSEAGEKETYVEINLNDDKVVPAKVIETINGSNAELIFNVGNDIVCIIEGKDVKTSGTSDINFNISANTDNDAAYKSAISKAETLAGILNFESEEEFGTTVELIVNVDAVNNEEWANLYCPDESTGAYKLVQMTSIGEDGSVGFELTKADDYFITISSEKATPSVIGGDDKKEDSTPTAPTSDVSESTSADSRDETDSLEVSKDNAEPENNNPVIIIVIVAAVAVVCVAVILILAKKKNKN